MPRPKSAVPKFHLHVLIPAAYKEKMDDHLYSPLEGKVPSGEFGRFVTRLIGDYFAMKAARDATMKRKGRA